ncbi:MAG: type 1 glutamine amidotransferase [Gammaproteobacteria bacterium]|nr:type 1 glutamine amidotransferase [Gammaproteobacteria bacterium]
MKPILIFRHFAGEGPGYLTEVLDRHGLRYQLIAIDAGDTVPIDPALFSGLVFMGGPMSVNDPLPWVTQELTLIRKAQELRIPILGHCLGGQLISKALGGTIDRNPVKELGWLPVTQTSNDVNNEWLHGLAQNFEVFHWHGERFTLPKNAVHLFGSDFCTNQAFSLGNTLGLQCHVEMTVSMVRHWAEHFDQEGVAPSASIQNPTAMTEDLARRVERLQKIADVLYARWLKPILISK